jgi:hypothetical protein
MPPLRRDEPRMPGPMAGTDLRPTPGPGPVSRGRIAGAACAGDEADPAPGHDTLMGGAPPGRE